MKQLGDLVQRGMDPTKAREMLSALQDLGTTSVGVGKASDAVSQFVDAVTKGRLSGAELKSLLPGLDSELKKMGLSMSDLADPSKQAQVFQALYNTAVKDAAPVIGATDKAMKGLEGSQVALNTATKELEQAFGQGMAPAIAKITPLLSELAQWLIKNKDAIGETVGAIGSFVTTAASWANAIGNFLLKPVDDFIGRLMELPGQLNEIDADIRSTFTNFKNAGAALIQELENGIAEKWGEFTGYFKDKLKWITDQLPHSDAKEGPLSQLTSQGAALWKTFAAGMKGAEGDLLSAVLSGAQAVFSAISNIASQAGKAWDGLKKGFEDIKASFSGGFNFSGLMSGITGITGAIGSIISIAAAAFSALKNLFSHNWGKDVANQLNLAGFSGVSEALQKQIAALAKSIGDADTAVFLSLSQISQEIPITAQNFTDFFNKTMEGFSLLQRGFITTEQLVSTLNDMFPKLQAEVEATGQVWSVQMLQMIEQAKNLGLSVQSINDYLTKMSQQAVDSLGKLFADFDAQFGKLMEKLGSSSGPIPFTGQVNAARHQIGQLQDYLMATFNSMVQAGVPIDQILQQLGPDFDQLAAYMAKMGLTGSKAFQQLLKEEHELAKEKGVITHLQHITDENASLFASGLGTDKMFHTLENTIAATTKKMGGLGNISHAELASMVPSLQEVIREHELLGIPIDANTQKLIDLAKKDRKSVV